MFCGCTARFVSPLIGNTVDRFSHEPVHTIVYIFQEITILPRDETLPDYMDDSQVVPDLGIA